LQEGSAIAVVRDRVFMRPFLFPPGFTQSVSGEEFEIGKVVTYDPPRQVVFALEEPGV